MLRGLAGLHATRTAPVHHGADRPVVQGHPHSGRLASNRRASRDSSHDRERCEYRTDDAVRNRAGGVIHRRHVAGDAIRWHVRAGGSGLRAVSRVTGIPDDGHASQRREPGDRLHVARERSGARRDRRPRHAARRGDQCGLLGSHRILRRRHFPVPHPRAIRHGRSAGARHVARRIDVSVSIGTAALTGLLGIPSLGAVLLAAIPNYRIAAPLNVTLCALTLVSAGALYLHRPVASLYLLVDDVNTVCLLIGFLVGFTTSVFSAGYIAHELQTRRLRSRDLRFYHAMYQLLMFAMDLALVSNNIGLMWVAIELATLTTVVMVGIYRTSAALEAAWKYFILGSVGIALALFGTILVYLAAEERLGQGILAMAWDHLAANSAGFDPSLPNFAFVFLFLRYSTKVGLAPLHAWLPDAHAEGPTPISAVLSGLLLNVALYAVLRFKMLLAANPAAVAPGPLMVTLGLTSVIFAAFMLYRRRDIKRMFAYSSIEHMGVIVFAFGMGGPLANFAGLLHMTMHSLTKSAIFFSVGHVAQVKGTQQIAGIRGLTITHPILGWTLVAGVVAIAGLPPFGIFTSEFLVISSPFPPPPLLAIPLVFGILVAFGALLLRLQGMAFGEPSPGVAKA